MGGFISYEVQDLFKQALGEKPDLVFTYVRQELNRFVKRFRKRVVSDRMSGPPGISGGAFRESSNKNLQTFVIGKSADELVAVAKISRFLRVHEEGATIHAKGGGYLYIKKGGVVVARVKQVTIPARLGFVDTWNSMTPEAVAKVHDAVERALRVQGERTVNAITNVFGSAA